MSGFRTAWGAVPPPPSPPPPPPLGATPTPALPPVRAPKGRPARNSGILEPLARQIAEALVAECEARELTLPEFASLTGVGLSSIRAHRYGQGLRVDTLQRYAERLGWRVVITDINGTEIGRL